MAPKTKDLVFAALGGVGEIGMNLALYGVGPPNRRDWIMVDLGVTFADETLPGIDLVFPDTSFIEAHRDRLRGIVLTHAHEDHFGAVIDLWPQLKAPVYATPFAAALLRAKMAEEGLQDRIPITEVPVGGHFEVGPFALEYIAVTHSIPEPTALAITTEFGTVLHTGDWKIDDKPTLGEPFDVDRLAALGDAGCRAMICDSTNVFRQGVSPGEGDVAETLKTLVAEASARVAITAFASNVARIRSAALAAAHAGREVVVAGRALQRVIAVARETGYLEEELEFLPQDAFAELPRRRVMLICTGSQGEPRAALARIAAGEHPAISLAAGDKLIFSARAIPGNDRAIGRVHNGLVRQGIEVITDADALVHVSGHPRRDEMRRMYELVRPELAVPVHGEARHLAEHGRLARELSVAEVVVAGNGDLIRLAPGPGTILDQVPSGRRVKDGRLILPEDDEALRERRQISHIGLVAVSFTITAKGELASDPQARLRGVPVEDANREDLLELVLDVVEDTFESMPRARRRDAARVGEAVRRAVRAAVGEAWGKRPVCEVMVHEV